MFTKEFLFNKFCLVDALIQEIEREKNCYRMFVERHPLIVLGILTLNMPYLLKDYFLRYGVKNILQTAKEIKPTFQPSSAVLKASFTTGCLRRG